MAVFDISEDGVVDLKGSNETVDPEYFRLYFVIFRCELESTHHATSFF